VGLGELGEVSKQLGPLPLNPSLTLSGHPSRQSIPRDEEPFCEPFHKTADRLSYLIAWGAPLYPSAGPLRPDWRRNAIHRQHRGTFEISKEFLPFGPNFDLEI
jgi:hypothetical protein